MSQIREIFECVNKYLFTLEDMNKMSFTKAQTTTTKKKNLREFHP